MNMATIKFKLESDMTAEILKAKEEQVLLGLHAIGQEAEGYAKGNCPVDTGMLRNSITYAVTGEGPATQRYSSDDGSRRGSYSGSVPKDDVPVVYIGTNVEYAEDVEFNDMRHRTGKAHFLRDAATTHSDRYKDIMEAALKA